MLTLYIADAERGVGMKNLSQKEAIALLRNLEDSLDSYCGLNEEGKTAFRMAIEALSCSDIPNNSDTISRQAVTKFLNDWLSCLFENCHKQSASDLKMIIKDFKNLPSAQPEIIRCKDCKYYKYGICMKIGVNKSFYGFCDWAERGEQNG